MTNQVIVKEILLSAPSAIPEKSKNLISAISAGIENILNKWREFNDSKVLCKSILQA